MKKIHFILLAASITFAAFGFVYKTSNTSTPVSETYKVGLNIGDEAPDLAFENPDGKVMKLSELRGNLVLVDFWASWCGPCRRENPNLVRAHKKYNKADFKEAKGFEIFSVSLDGIKRRDGRPISKDPKADWKRAIEKDQLSWKYHVSDLGGWQSEAARIYNINSIPSNVLVDKKGIIIAKNLRGPALEAELKKHLK